MTGFIARHLGPAIAVAAILAALPLFVIPHTLIVFVVYAILALSLGLIWGFGGILCFGQAALFGLGAYSFAITGLNFGDAWLALLFSILVPGIFALLLGIILFYGRLGDVYLAVVTLVVSLLLFKFMNATAGPEYVIGTARLGGFNGIPAFPTLYFPFAPDDFLFDGRQYALVCFVAFILWLGVQALLESPFGRFVIATGENEVRMQLLGYNTRLIKVALFGIGGMIAGLAGGFYANWAEIVTPALFSLGQSAEIIIWVIVGGVGTLLGPMIGAFLLGGMKFALGFQSVIDNIFFMGILLVAVVLWCPEGILPLIARRFRERGFLNSSRHRRRALRDGDDTAEDVSQEVAKHAPQHAKEGKKA